jgi:hypothetical protein
MSATSALEAAPDELAGGEQDKIATASTADAAAETEASGDTVGDGQTPEDEEQKEVKEAKEEGAAGSQGTPTPELSQEERVEMAGRIRQLQSLPPALRECLAKVVEASADSAADGRARVPIETTIRAIEEALPDFLRIDGSRGTRPAHPAGEAFFRGDPSELSDARAEEIARSQLARSGLLRGQRVRVSEE